MLCLITVICMIHGFPNWQKSHGRPMPKHRHISARKLAALVTPSSPSSLALVTQTELLINICR